MVSNANWNESVRPVSERFEILLKKLLEKDLSEKDKQDLRNLIREKYNWQKIDDIWSGEGYHWDSDKQEYEILQ